MSIKFAFPIILILIPPSLSYLECHKCEEQRDRNGTLINGNCLETSHNITEMRVVNCLYKCSIFHASNNCAKMEDYCHQLEHRFENSSKITCHMCDYDLCNIALNKTRYKTKKICNYDIYENQTTISYQPNLVSNNMNYKANIGIIERGVVIFRISPKQ
uniref:CSON010802 protein n=1 Tax=Culicoides sonorensis TaxID=179676 RepID=A0A336M2H8_CULSO